MRISKFTPGVVQLGLVALVLVGLTVAASLGISASHNKSRKESNRARSSAVVSKKSPCPPLGDLDKNGKISAVEVDEMERYLAGQSTLFQPSSDSADVNGDGQINTVDILLIRQFLDGKLKGFTGCPPTITYATLNSLNHYAPSLRISGYGFGTTQGTVLIDLHDGQSGLECILAGRSSWSENSIRCAPDHRLHHVGNFDIIVKASDGEESREITVRGWLGRPDENPVARPTCLGDVNGDGIVNDMDISAVQSNYYTTNSAYDLNKDGRVTTTDLVIVTQNYLKCNPIPAAP